jgi:hypothetical protein
VLEYWLRKYSEVPLENYGIELYEPSYISLLRNKFNISINPLNKIPEIGCPNLSANGCSIQWEERPIKCIGFTCQNLRNAMSWETEAQHMEINDQLYNICMKTFDILKKEAGINRIYGKLSIFISL